MDSELQRHEMVLEKSHEFGAEEWFCPVCGRRFLLQWPPNYQRIILEQGDNNAVHSGGKGGLNMETPRTSRMDQIEPDEPELSTNESDLAPWKEWMEKVDFESLWADGTE